MFLPAARKVSEWNSAPNKDIVGPTIRGVLPHWDTDRFTLVLEVDGKKHYSSTYTLHYEPIKRELKSDAAKQLNQ